MMNLQLPQVVHDPDSDEVALRVPLSPLRKAGKWIVNALLLYLVMQYVFPWLFSFLPLLVGG